MSEWKTGEVYMVTCKTPPTRFAAVRDHKGWNSLDPGIGFAPDSDVVDACPLVVIDPEDREQVERLEAAFADALGWTLLANTPRVDGMQAALREFADPKPPKPEEPTGWGAVVEDRDGWYWTLVAPDSAAWANYGHSGYRQWSDIDAVRVLSEGVTS